jgi:hypothetical protein
VTGVVDQCCEKVSALIGAPLRRGRGVRPTMSLLVARSDQMAVRGIDEEFGRGGDAYDRFYGDPTIKPSPNLGYAAGNTTASVMGRTDP